MDSHLEQWVRQAKDGDKQALERVVGEIQNTVFGLALRMSGAREDAEDDAQEILIKVITHLSDFREKSAFRSWVYRIACNHLLTSRKRRTEQAAISFEILEAVITSETETTGCPVPPGPERAIILEEGRLRCMQAVLSCLDREIRIAFVLGEVFEVSSAEGGYILNISPEAFRKRLSRGRERVHAFMLKNCGLVNATNPCRCLATCSGGMPFGTDGIGSTVRTKRLEKSRTEAMMRLKELSEIERVTLMFRTYPEYTCPDAFATIIKDLIDSGNYRILMRS
jgi:RNA polymerase sigma factor (sigma-70 family)